MKKFWIVSVMLAIGLLLGTQSISLAVPYIEVGLVDSLGNHVYVKDGDPLDTNTAVGVVTYNGPVGSGPWTVNVTTGQTYPTGGTAAVPYLDLNSIDSSNAGGKLSVFVDAIGYTGPISGGNTGPFVFEVGGTLGGLTTGSIDLWAGYEAGNLLYTSGGIFTTIGTLGPYTGSGFFGGSTDIAAFPGTTSPYGLAIQANITHDGAGTTSFDSSLKSGKVPEPISLILLGSGLAGAGLYRRLRKPKG